MRKINGQYNWLGRKQSDLDVAMRAREADSAELKVRGYICLTCASFVLTTRQAKLDKVSEELEELKVDKQ